MIEKSEVTTYPEQGISGFPERLKDLIGKESLKDFANAVGISEGGLRKYLPPAKSIPSFDKLVRFARYKNVSLDWLATGEGEKDVFESKKTESFTEEFVLIDGYHSQVEDISIDNNLGEVRRRLAFRKKWLKWRGLDPSKLKIFFVQSTVENGMISSGDTVMIDFSDRKISDGTFALKLRESTVIRHFVARLDGSFDVHIEKSKEATERITEDDANKLDILGRIVWLGKDIL
ncbi:helix-turn-helix domain-containing protein [Vibrio cholerae]|nr:helix-turn-helix domain-containing protein [Vibrio cholerae]ELC9567473.1 helix-turn-helix domain-containing protein [Vibrio cholerae]ELK8282261.1 helix-turn-helix domain-containing protein [Vibrio cholerae]